MSAVTYTRPLCEYQITRELAESLVRREVNSTVRALQGINAGLSGDDSGLSNAWDEICVQVQGQKSFHWDTYLQTIRDFIAGGIENLKRFEMEAIWLQTPEGEQWDCEDEDSREANPAYSGDVVTYIVNEVVNKAANYENRKIRTYLDGCYEPD